MNKRLILTFFLAFAVPAVVFGQKVKYKELFVWLNAKQYEKSEVFLKKYLKENDDNPNAYLYMGRIYEDKASKLDILTQTGMYLSQLDSAVYFYRLCSKIMTEKEVSRNDEYYQDYGRRDQRSGKFGVSYSDVVLDLETKMKLAERSKQVGILKSQIVASEASYLRAVNLFTKMQKRYIDQSRLYLQADDSLVADLHQIAVVMDSCRMHFNDYESTTATLEKPGLNQNFKTGYHQDLNPQDIKDYKVKAVPVDFHADDVKILDFKRWALHTAEVIEKEISPLKGRLIAHDTELNKLQHKLKSDSVSVRAEMATLHAKDFSDLLKIDPNPMPLQLFAMKEAELEFGCVVVENRPLRDSLNVAIQMSGLKREILYAKKLDSIAGLLMTRNLDEDAINYRHFVTTGYGTSSVLKSNIKGTKEFASRSVARREKIVNKKSEFLRWIVSGSDSIPLFFDVLATGRFRPLIIKEEKFTAGLLYADTVGAGYFYLITPSRRPEVKATFPVNPQVFKKRFIPLTKAISAQDDKGLVYFILTYLESKVKDKYKGTLTKIYKVEGLSWSVNVEFDQVPAELFFSKDTSELIVKTKSSIGEMFVMTFDRNGKLIK